MSLNNKVIVICPNIPPNPGVGGRRWAKFAKYLDRNGVDVTVVGFKYDKERPKSNWSRDLEKLSEEGKVVLIPHHFSEILGTSPTSLIDKIRYRIHLLRNKARLKGNYFDSSAFWYKSLLPFLKKRIGDTPTTIIATGAPFTYLHSILELKKSAHIKIVTDYRDPWVNNEIGYGYAQLPQERFAFEQQMELEVFQQSDLLLNVYQEQLDYSIERIGPTKKSIVLPNGFDKDDLDHLSTSEKKPSDKIRFVFGGTLYNDAYYAFDLLIDALDTLKTDRPEMYAQLEFNFYGNKIPALAHHFEGEHAGVLFAHGRVSLEEMYQKIYDSDFVMVFLTKAMNYTKNTKFLECINLNKKILVFSNTGFLEQHVEEHEIGYSMTEGNTLASFEKVFADAQSAASMTIPPSYNIDEYNIANLTKELVAYLRGIESVV